jgi:hypothetical protein
VRNADYGDTLDVGVVIESVLDIDAGDVLTAADDDVFLAGLILIISQASIVA